MLSFDADREFNFGTESAAYRFRSASTIVNVTPRPLSSGSFAQPGHSAVSELPLHLGSSAETGKVVDAVFECFDFPPQIIGLRLLTRSQTVFQPLEA